VSDVSQSSVVLDKELDECVSVNAGCLISCQAAPGIRERCVSSGRNSSVFELIWTVDPQASRLQ
jgi:hypothetical protein